MQDFKQGLWRQFGASIDMLTNAVKLWPDDEWQSDHRCFYMAYHVAVFLNYYLTIPPDEMKCALPFTIAEPDAVIDGPLDDLVPDRIYSKKELLDYIGVCREKCREVISGLTEHNLSERWIVADWNMNYSVLELLLYNMRHVQHHSAQINLMLRQKIGDAPRWVRAAM